MLESGQMSPQLSREEIKKIIVEALRPYGVTRIALFGSFARQESSPHDIDILVALPPHGRRKPIGMKWFVLDKQLEDILGMPIDLVTEDSLNPRLWSEIQKDLDVIYEKAG